MEGISKIVTHIFHIFTIFIFIGFCFSLEDSSIETLAQNYDDTFYIPPCIPA